jgi:hypothetical protein
LRRFHVGGGARGGWNGHFHPRRPPCRHWSRWL